MKRDYLVKSHKKANEEKQRVAAVERERKQTFDRIMSAPRLPNWIAGLYNYAR